MLNVKFILNSGYTQKEIAEGLGLKPQIINNYIKGKTEPNIKTLIELAKFLHTTTDNILGHEVPYLLDKSTLTPEQREIIEIVPQMNYEECKIMLAYLAGVKKGIEERNENFYINNKGE